MDRLKRFVDWCQQPSKVKIRTFNPKNIILIALSVLLISTIASATWLYQVLSIASTPALTRDNYESLFPTLIITKDTVLTEDYRGEVIIEADGITLDGNGHTITGPGLSNWNYTQRMWDISTGITAKGRTGVTVKNCRVTNFAYGLFLNDCNGCALLNNTVNENLWGGFVVQSSYNNTLLYNTANSNNYRDVNVSYDGQGFMLAMSFGNTFKGNTANDNARGFSLSEGCDGNIFEASTVKDNSECGFWLYCSSNNTFSRNNLIDNSIQVMVMVPLGYANIWDKDYPSGGNYWSDYEGVDADGDGIGDTPYVILSVSYKFDETPNPGPPVPIFGEPDGNNVDSYPLMAPING
jgi:parallel beta-helix repeat protein